MSDSRMLDMSGALNNYEDRDYFAESFRDNTNIMSLNLSRNNLTDTAIWNISHNRTLVKLNLSENKLRACDLVSLCDMLRNTETLTSLNLSNNHIDDKGVKRLVDALTVNTSLRHLNLSKNKFRTNGVMELCNMLKTNSTLTKLDVSYNNIANDVTTLVGDNNLRCLNLSGLNLQDDDVVKLVPRLMLSCLTNVKLDDNKIGDNGLHALITHKPGIKLSLMYNDITKVGEYDVKIKLYGNKIIP